MRGRTRNCISLTYTTVNGHPQGSICRWATRCILVNACLLRNLPPPKRRYKFWIRESEEPIQPQCYPGPRRITSVVPGTGGHSAYTSEVVRAVVSHKRLVET